MISCCTRTSIQTENKLIMKEIQNRDWQYLVESGINLVKNDKSVLKPLSKAEKKNIKSMKYNYKVA